MPIERFRDRETAGKKLAAIFAEHAYENPIVLGLPWGGMVVAAEIANALPCELGFVVSRKLEAPYQPALTLGAVTADGVAYVDAGLAEEVGANQHYLAQEQHRKSEQARRLRDELHGSRGFVVAGRDVLVVTDGLTTGARAVATVRSATVQGARSVIAVAPVAPPDAIGKLRQEAAEVVCLVEASTFLSVAQFYEDFQPIDNPTVRHLLRTAAASSFS